MGYTHYFKIHDFDGDGHLVTEVRDIIAQAESDGIALAGPDGNGTPVVIDSKIMLNGRRDLHQDHEPFVIPNDGGYDGYAFCKTARKPYDAVVTAILVSAIVNGVGSDVSSDGTYVEWQDGIALYERAVRKLTKSERQNMRRVLNHEFRTSVIMQLRHGGYDVRLSDVDNGIYEITYADATNQIAALGSATNIAYDALKSKTGWYCHSTRLSDAFGRIDYDWEELCY